jgi:hypothetical protein
MAAMDPRGTDAPLGHATWLERRRLEARLPRGVEQCRRRQHAGDRPLELAAQHERDGVRRIVQGFAHPGEQGTGQRRHQLRLRRDREHRAELVGIRRQDQGPSREVLSLDREGLGAGAPDRAHEQHGEHGHGHDGDHRLEQNLHQQRCQDAGA